MAVSYIDNDGGKLAVELRGPATGPLVVCSPGMGDIRDAYGPLADQLAAAGYRVALVDLRGLGDASVGFSDYGNESTARDYIKVIEHLAKPGEPAVLAGASMSAAAATIAAGRRPDLVAGLILLGPFLRNGVGAVFRAVMSFALWRPWGPWVWKSYSGSLWPGLPEKERDARVAHTAKLLTRPGRWPAFHATTGVDHSQVDPWLLKAMHQPALVVIGDKDPDWSKPLEEAAWVASQFTNATTLTVPAAGHAPMFEKPDVVGPEVIRFLAPLRAEGGKAFKPSSSARA